MNADKSQAYYSDAVHIGGAVRYKYHAYYNGQLRAHGWECHLLQSPAPFFLWALASGYYARLPANARLNYVRATPKEMR